MRYLLIGNYGVSNLGDEALKDYFLSAFPDAGWVVVGRGESSVTPSVVEERHRCHASTTLSMTPSVPRLPFGFRSLFVPWLAGRSSAGRSVGWWRTIREYRRCDGVVFGGGSLFTDTESVKAPMLWWWHAFAAWCFGKPIFLAFQGIGPFRTRIGTMLTRWVVRHARFVSVRDRASFDRVRKWRDDVVQSFDPIVGHPSLIGRGRGGFEEYSCNPPLHPPPIRGGCLLLIPRANSNQTFLNRAKEVYEHEKFDTVKILSLQPSDPHEQAVCRKLEMHLHQYTSILVYGYADLTREVESASFVLSERYHGALAALALDIPFETVPQADGDKLMELKNISREEALRLVQDGEHALRLALRL